MKLSEFSAQVKGERSIVVEVLLEIHFEAILALLQRQLSSSVREIDLSG